MGQSPIILQAFLAPRISGAKWESFMSVNSMGAMTVSPYLASAMSRIQTSELAAKSAGQSSAAPSSGAAQTGGTQVLGSQVMGVLVGLQIEK